MRRLLLLVLSLVTLVTGSLRFSTAQEQKQTRSISASARLIAPKTAILKRGGGSDIPFNVVESSLTGWGRFELVDDPAKADIIIEISAPYDNSGVSVSSSASTSPLTGRDVQSTTTSRQLTIPQIVLTVSDARSHLRLWTATERPKNAMKQKTREDNLVEASQRLFAKLRDHIEPPQ